MSDFRKERGKTQPIYLIRLEIDEKEDENMIVFHVLGTTKRVYKVYMVPRHEPRCTCPDHTVRKTVCKHMYFIGEKIVKLDPTAWVTVENFEEIIPRVKHFPQNVVASKYYTDVYNQFMDGKPIEDVEESKLERRNMECSVCLCDFEDTDEERKDTLICHVCRNGIHSECWNRWRSVNGSEKCVYCRSKIEKHEGKAKIIKDAGWAVLLQ
jgi:hypothetical protein